MLVLHAQQYYFRSYQKSDGLSSNTVTCIKQDAAGFMWFGTRNGLNRFDGTSFKVFKNDANDRLSIGSNSILSLYEDKQHQLWIGTYRGLYKYDALHENFLLFQKIPQVEVKNICSDTQGNMWIIAKDQLYKYRISNDSIENYTGPDGDCVALNIRNGNDVWTAYTSGAVKHYNVLTGNLTNYNITTLLHTEFPVVIQTIYPVADTAILIATSKQILLLNAKTLQVTDVLSHTPWQNNIQAHVVMEQSPGIYWLGTENGLYTVDLPTGKITHIEKQVANPYTINDNIITSFCKDKEGNTWVGTRFGGVNYHSNQLNQFQKYFTLPGINSLKGNLVHEICTDDKDNTWIGTEDAGLNKLDPKTGLFKHFAPGKAKGDITYHNIHGLLADGDKLWIGTYEHGLDVMDLRTEKVIRHYQHGPKPNDLNGDFIVSLYKTKSGDILVGTWNALFKYNKSTDDFSIMPFFQRQAQAIHEDHNGTLWVCTYGDGVYYQNERTGDKGSFKFDINDKNSLSSNHVNNLFEDNNRRLWFCTETGLCYYDSTSKKIIRYVAVPELINNQVFKILQDDAGLFWISTSNGLVCLNASNNQYKIYTTANGLLSDQFNYNSGFKNRDGNLYFGTVKGMVSFNPSSFSENNFIPPVFITSLLVNNKDLQIDSTHSPLKQSIQHTKKVVLPYNESSLVLSVSALSYTMPALNSYMYKMEGLDKDWTTIKSNRKIYYTKLPPGHYTFKVKGSNGDNVWNNNITSLDIQILPPWWASTWAYILYALTISGILFIISRYYFIAMHEKNQRRIKMLDIAKEREIYNAKIEFFTNVTHEIRTPLTLIKLPVEKLLKITSGDVQLREHLMMIEKNTERLINLTNQLLDFRKAEANNYTLNFVKTDINELLKDLFIAYKPIAEEKKLSFKLEIPRITLMAYVDPEALRKIVGNLLSNAIKYAGQNISVRLLPFNSEDNLFHIEFRNDGFIIPAELKDKIFEPFFRLKQTERSAGTGIGLALSRSLSELHKGRLELKQPVNNFNLFLLSIPVHQDTEIKLDEYEIIENDVLIDEDETVVTGEEPLHRTSILLVEDNKDIIRFLQKELHTNYNVYTAYDGQQALDILSRQNIHLVISDIMMPVMDGIDLCRNIKTDVEYSHIPVILLTAKNTITSKIQGLETGADAYIEKPFVMEYLMAQINSLLNNRNHIKEYYAHSPLAHIKGIALTKADSGFLEELKLLIDENITRKDLDIDTLAKMMNMSRGTFYRKIKGVSNLTPNELINLSRLKKAAELLAEGQYKINEVANLVGYNANSNFSRDFHKQFGVSPSEYLKNLKKSENEAGL